MFETEKSSGRNAKFLNQPETKDYHNDVIPFATCSYLPRHFVAMNEKKKMVWHRVWPWVVGGLLVAYFYAYFAAMTTGDVDLAQCHALEAAVVARNAIPASVSAPGQPGIFCDRAIQIPFLRRYEKVFVYGVTDKTAQDRVLAAIREFQLTRGGGRVLVEFFEKENWIAWSDQSGERSGGHRGPEVPVREVWVR